MTGSFNDDELKAFLQKHQPVAPPAPRGELDQLFAKLRLKQKESQLRSWFAFGGLAAAGLAAAFIFSGSQKDINEYGLDHREVVVYEGNFEENFFEEELPALEVGGNYFELVATIE